MTPTDMTYDICRHYVRDQKADVDPALWRIVDGYRRSRNLAGLSSCSSHFDVAVHSINDWRFTRQVEAFFKKNANFSDRHVCRDEAFRSFCKAEDACSETNMRLHNVVKNPRESEWFNTIVRMRRYISTVLGDCSSFIEMLPYLVKVTPGATANAKRRDSLPQMKMRLKLYATRNAHKYLRALYHFYGFKTLVLKATHSNRIELVPKSWKTDRTIACEPEGNLPLQLAFDTYAKRRLRSVGINLYDQTANQRLAREGSLLNELCTVDFSAASDTISFNTVSLLFPVEWFKFLWDVRSPGYRGKFGEGVYSKFSSMGNGSTFTIETLIFAAACYAVRSKRFSVYGDDVIIERECFDSFQRLTQFLGFSINTDKTFLDGPFRESCGSDWFNGIDVTPVYIRNIDFRKASLCHLVNTLMALTSPESSLGDFLIETIGKFKLPWVPFNESTISGVWIEPDLARRKGILRRKYGIDRYKAFVPRTKNRVFADSRGYYLWFLYKNSQVLYGGPWHTQVSIRPTQTSSVPVFQHYYVRKRVYWHKPVEATPIHLEWIGAY